MHILWTVTVFGIGSTRTRPTFASRWKNQETELKLRLTSKRAQKYLLRLICYFCRIFHALQQINMQLVHQIQ